MTVNVRLVTYGFRQIRRALDADKFNREIQKVMYPVMLNMAMEAKKEMIRNVDTAKNMPPLSPTTIAKKRYLVKKGLAKYVNNPLKLTGLLRDSIQVYQLSPRMFFVGVTGGQLHPLTRMPVDVIAVIHEQPAWAKGMFTVPKRPFVEPAIIETLAKYAPMFKAASWQLQLAQFGSGRGKVTTPKTSAQSRRGHEAVVKMRGGKSQLDVIRNVSVNLFSVFDALHKHGPR
jgi:hypothetical protein